MPKQLPILQHPHPVLRKKSVEISAAELADPAIQEFLQDLEETMKNKDGAGLAAPQVGKSIRVCVVSDDKHTIFMINPQITKKSWARETEEEGCLSILNERGEIIYALVARHKKINCVYLDKKGQVKKLKAEKMLARVIQHEIDHLDGILFIDRLTTNPPTSAPTQNTVRPKA